MTALPSAPVRPLTVALIGNPNTGKSTLFNALAGMQARVANFPGVTVEKKLGRMRCGGREVRLVDLPGTYSLSPRSLDELVSVDVLLGRQRDVGAIDAVVCIVDASNLERNLYLVSQVLDLRLPTVVVLNMSDLAGQRGMTIDAAALEERLGVPVIPTSAHKRRGIEAVREAIVQVAAADEATDGWLGSKRSGAPSESPTCPPIAGGDPPGDLAGRGGRPAADRPQPPHFDPKSEGESADGASTSHRPSLFPDAFYAECERLEAKLAESNGVEPPPRYLVERMLLDVGGAVEERFERRTSDDLASWLKAARERLRQAGCRIPGVEAQVRYAWVREVLDGVLVRPSERVVTSSDSIDRVLTHRVAGMLIFAAVMFVVFVSIFLLADPVMQLVEAGPAALGDMVAGVMSPGTLRSLIVDGVIGGVGSVLVFLPQIAILFLFIALLEDCGYMARAAFLMDRLMRPIGLSGKSFVPLMSSFACAIPGIMATRVIENRRDRMVTILVAPLMSCSARLPVYLLLTALFVPDEKWLIGGLVLFAMYSLGVLVAVPVAWTLKKTFFQGETPPFVMELPSYKWPSPRIVLSRVYDRSKAFVVRAGTLIFATMIVVWAAGYFPGDHARENALVAQLEVLEGVEEPAAEQEARLESLREEINVERGELIAGSFLGRAGHAIEPFVEPLGWDWKIGVGAIASFPAREVIIGTLGTIYSLGGDVDEEDEGLRAAMQSSTRADGTPVYTIPVALSIMVFFALCAQCAATLMVIRRETNSWRWPAFTFAYMTILAYLGAWATFALASRLPWESWLA
ncbi:MAG: ferrous iron transport protein B [Planctomycetaceae bacterium]